jgi:hypothetical protein
MLTNDQIIGIFAATFPGADKLVAAEENEHRKRTNTIRWRDQILNENTTYKSK